MDTDRLSIPAGLPGARDRVELLRLGLQGAECGDLGAGDHPFARACKMGGPINPAASREEGVRTLGWEKYVISQYGQQSHMVFAIAEDAGVGVIETCT